MGEAQPPPYIHVNQIIKTMKNIQGTKENLELFNSKSKRVYEFITDLDGYSVECTFDDNGNELTYKDSNGFIYECTYDEKEIEKTYKDSNGFYKIKRKRVTKEEYEAFINN
jgi:hypothetical protein